MPRLTHKVNVYDVLITPKIPKDGKEKENVYFILLVYKAYELKILVFSGHNLQILYL